MLAFRARAERERQWLRDAASPRLNTSIPVTEPAPVASYQGMRRTSLASAGLRSASTKRTCEAFPEFFARIAK